jgi:hypothetical protein
MVDMPATTNLVVIQKKFSYFSLRGGLLKFWAPGCVTSGDIRFFFTGDIQCCIYMRMFEAMH